jgi:hypothetical protein
MTQVMIPRQGQTGEAWLTTADAPSCLRTTLYDVMTALQTAVEPDEDNLVVAIVAYWLRSGRIALVRERTVAA